MKPTILAAAFAALPTLTLAEAHQAPNPTVGGAEMLAERNIIENAVNSPIHTTLVAAVQAAGLVETLQGDGPFTVFAPTDTAFAALPGGTVDTLLQPENTDALTEVLTCHVVGANAMSDAIGGMIADDGDTHPVETLGGCVLMARMSGDMITLTDEQGRTATVTTVDVRQSNGVIHVIDTVMLPAAEEASAESMEPDMAMGDNPTVGGAAMFAERNIIENAVNSPIHTTLVAAVQAAGLVETLQGDGPFTVFAPTDEAFAALPEGTVDTLLQPENKGLLTKVLTAHVVAGRVTADDLARQIRASSDEFFHFNALSGDALSAQQTPSGRIFIYDESGNAYEVTTADVMQSNGVIHVVEGVLLPR